MLLIKTSQALEANVYETIKEMHNYDTPEISTIKTSNVDEDYLKWINESLELGKK